MTYKPYKISCGPYIYQVRWMEPGDTDHDNNENWGTVDATSRTVRFMRDMDQPRLLETKLHEYIHVVEMTFGLDFPEEVVRILGVGLAQILRDRVDIKKL